MPQAQLPFFPSGTTEINVNLAFEKKDGRVTYFYGTLPVFFHEEDDLPTFQMIISQLHINGSATQAELCRAFGVTAISVKRAVKKYRERGAAGFFKPRNTRGATVLTEEILVQAQSLLDQGEEVSDAAKTLGIKSNTLNKAILDGRLHKPLKKKTRIAHNKLSAAKANAMPWITQHPLAWVQPIPWIALLRWWVISVKYRLTLRHRRASPMPAYCSPYRHCCR